MSFITTPRPTAYGFFDSDPDFISEANAFALYVRRRLGDSVVSVELTREQMWTYLEAAVVKWCSIVNLYDFNSYVADLIGQPKPLVPEGLENKLVKPSLSMINWRAYTFSVEAGLGGEYEMERAVMAVEETKQIYDLKTDLIGFDGKPLWSSPKNGNGMRMRILEVFHLDPSFIFLNLRPQTAINHFVTDMNSGRYLQWRFFYVLPVFDDIVRGMHLKQSNQLRRSHFTWRIRGTKFFLYPPPRAGRVFPLFFDVAFVPSSVGSGLEGEIDPTTVNTETYSKGNVISNLSNAPYGLFEYNSINSIGREWVREYGLALCKEGLGLTRGKYGSFPIPSDTLSLNSSDLLTQAQSEKEALVANLKETLEELTVAKVTERRATEQESQMKVLSGTPFKKPVWIA